MRSSQIGVNPKSNGKYVCKKRRHREEDLKMETEIKVITIQETPGATRCQKSQEKIFPRAFGECSPMHLLILEFWPQKLREKTNSVDLSH